MAGGHYDKEASVRRRWQIKTGDVPNGILMALPREDFS